LTEPQLQVTVMRQTVCLKIINQLTIHAMQLTEMLIYWTKPATSPHQESALCIRLF